MSGWARAAGWWAVAALIGWLCLWSAADRLAGQGVVLAVPPVLLTGGDALTARAWLADRRGEAAAAAALSRRALWWRPVDAATLRTGGFAALAGGETTRGDALLRLAGAAGWRDTPTQLYWAESAVRSGAWDVAAERLDALMRTSDDGAAMAAPLLRTMERSPAGRAALVRRLGVPNHWAGVWLADAEGLDREALEARVETAVLARTRLAGTTLSAIGRALIDRGRADLAWRLLRPRGGGLADLATASAGAGPFEWTLSAAAGLDARPDTQAGRSALHVEASGAALLPVASTLLRLPAGATRLTVAVSGATTDLPLVATLDCLGGGSGAAEPAGARPGQAAFALTVPAGCATQRLTLAVAGEEARRGADLWLRDAALSRAIAP